MKLFEMFDKTHGMAASDLVHAKASVRETGAVTPASIAADLDDKLSRNVNNVRDKMDNSPEPIRTMMYTLLPGAEEIDGTKEYHDIIDELEALWSGDPVQTTMEAEEETAGLTPEDVVAAWKNVFPNSSVHASKAFGGGYAFKFRLAKDKTEVSSGIMDNDPLHYSAILDTDGSWKEWHTSMFIAPPEGSHLVYSSAKFRKKSAKNVTLAQIQKRFAQVKDFVVANADKLKDPKFDINQKLGNAVTEAGDSNDEYYYIQAGIDRHAEKFPTLKAAERAGNQLFGKYRIQTLRVKHKVPGQRPETVRTLHLNKPNESIGEAWDEKTETPKSERGKYKGKTKAELKSMLSKVKASGPHKEGSDAFERQNELEFAIRAKSGWGKVTEAAPSIPDVQQDTVNRLKKSGGRIYNDVTLIKGDEVALLGRNGDVRFAIYPDGKFDRAKEFINFQKNGWELEMEMPKPKADKVNHRKLAGMIEDAVSMTMPDADPFDYLMSKGVFQKLEDVGVDPMEEMDKAAKKYLGSSSYNDYLADAWDQYAADHEQNDDAEEQNPWRESVGEAKTREVKQNWFETLNAALESEGLTSTWDGIEMDAISYGENRSYNALDDEGQCRHISIYRETDGRYERPVHYPSKMCS